MLENLRKKIELKRNSKKLFFKLVVLLKDIIWFFYYIIFYKMRNWPEVVFSRTYKEKAWGDEGDFFSGDGALPENTLKYRKFIEKFIEEKNIKSVVDLGCGDFRVGREINWANVRYTGVDVVKSLIERNNKFYSNQKIKFIKRNIIKDELPDADLCLIKEALQHLPNKDIKKILEKIKKYKYVLITDCLPRNLTKKINVDISMGKHRKYGLYLESPPFNIKIKEVLKYPKKDKEETMRTILLENKTN